MNIAIIGNGNVGQALAQRWLAKVHSVVFGSRDPDAPKIAALLAALGSAASSASLENASTHADVVLLAVPWEAALMSVRALGDLSNKVLIDATNPIAMNPAGLQAGLLMGHTTSADRPAGRGSVHPRCRRRRPPPGAPVGATRHALDSSVLSPRHGTEFLLPCLRHQHGLTIGCSERLRASLLLSALPMAAVAWLSIVRPTAQRTHQDTYRQLPP